jgi:hypothetical protein
MLSRVAGDSQVISTPHVNETPIELNASSTMRIASELPFTDAWPDQLAMSSGSSSRTSASSSKSVERSSSSLGAASRASKLPRPVFSPGTALSSPPSSFPPMPVFADEMVVWLSSVLEGSLGAVVWFVRALVSSLEVVVGVAAICAPRYLGAMWR